MKTEKKMANVWSSFVAVAICLGTAQQACAITDTTYTVDTSIPLSDDTLGTDNATWTISPGVTVTAGVGGNRPRFFINDATFTITGGGTLIQNCNDGYAGVRLGFTGVTHGKFIIEGGSTYRSTNTSAFFESYDGSGSLELNGDGSTFSAKGVYTVSTPSTGLFLADGKIAPANDVLVSVTNGTLVVTDLGGGFTQLSVSGVAPDAVAGVVGVNTIKLDTTGSIGALTWQASEDNSTWNDIVPAEIGTVLDVTSLYTNTPWFRVEAISGVSTNYSAAMQVTSQDTAQGTVIFIK